MQEKGEGLSGTCIEDSWIKPNGGRIEGGSQGWLLWMGVVG